MGDVVITGVGAVTPLGVGARALLERWCAGVSGIEDGAGRCREYEPGEHLSVKEARRADRCTQLARVAAAEALADAGWDEDAAPYDPEWVGCILGTGIGGIGTLEAAHDDLRDRGPKAVGPLSVPLMMSNAPAAAIALRHDLRGQTFGVVSACAAGAHAIGTAARAIACGDAVAVVTGGAEAALTPLSTSAFASMQALSPSGISRPFDARRDGFVMGEGAGVLVLEDGDAARARGARILGTVAGYGATSDAHHLTAPLADGGGAARAIALALRDAGRSPGDVVYVNAHGTSTPLNDRAETAAIKRGARRPRERRAGVEHEVLDRASARRRGRRRGDCHRARVARPRRPADARLGGARGGHGTRLRARRRAPARGRGGQSPARDQQLVRLRRPQRRPRPGGRGMTPLQIVPRPDERLSALERLEVLCDPGSVDLVRTGVVSRRMGAKAAAGDGVLGCSGRVDGRPIYAFAQDPSFAGGSLGAAHAETICTVLRLAGRARVPAIGFVASAGARMQEGLHALGGYGRIFSEHVALSGVVPQISIVAGASAGGGSYAPALTDHVIMTREAAMFLTGPGVVAEVMGEDVDAAALGGPKVHERNGVCSLVAETDADAAWLARDLLDYLPQRAGERPTRWPVVAPPEFAPDSVLPVSGRQVYDVREVARALVDGGRLLEVGGRWAKNIVTAYARLDGRAIGIVANQPRYLGGVLDAEAASKGARFVRTCDSFGLPLLVLVDTPGFMPGTKQEQAGVIRHGAKLVHAFAGATVPRITVLLRKAFGGAFIAMNSRDLGADLVLAWPGAQLGVMGAEQAVGIIERRAIAGADDPARERTRLGARYAAEHLGVERAVEDGFVDEVIPPSETRGRVVRKLAHLEAAQRGPDPAATSPCDEELCPHGMVPSLRVPGHRPPVHDAGANDRGARHPRLRGADG